MNVGRWWVLQHYWQKHPVLRSLMPLTREIVDYQYDYQPKTSDFAVGFSLTEQRRRKEMNVGPTHSGSLNDLIPDLPRLWYHLMASAKWVFLLLGTNLDQKGETYTQTDYHLTTLTFPTNELVHVSNHYWCSLSLSDFSPYCSLSNSFQFHCYCVFFPFCDVPKSWEICKLHWFPMSCFQPSPISWILVNTFPRVCLLLVLTDQQ